MRAQFVVVFITKLGSKFKISKQHVV